jgi:hypothetical protein
MKARPDSLARDGTLRTQLNLATPHEQPHHEQRLADERDGSDAEGVVLDQQSAEAVDEVAGTGDGEETPSTRGTYPERNARYPMRTRWSPNTTRLTFQMSK